MRGRSRIDKEAKQRDDRRRILEKGLVACYEIIDRIRREMAELAAQEQALRHHYASRGACGVDAEQG